MNENARLFDQLVKERRSVRIFDETAPWDGEAVQRSLERAVLAPNSSNLQLWEFYRVASEDKKKEMATYCLGQNAAKTANELVVIVTRKDKWKERKNFVYQKAKEHLDTEDKAREKLIATYYNKLIPILYQKDILGVFGGLKKIGVTIKGIKEPTPREVTASDVDIIVHKSAALAAQTFMLSMTAEGYDSCPMEGFDSSRVKQFLKLPSQASVTMVIRVGKPVPKGIYGPRVRVPNEEVIFKL